MKSYIKIKIKIISKRPFQLLELLVAAFILLICIAPTMHIFTSLYQLQQEIVRENQRDHLSHLIHAKITEMLYKNQIHLPVEKQAKETIELQDREIIDALKKYGYSCRAALIVDDWTQPRGQEHPSRYLLHLTIEFQDLYPKSTKKKKIQNQDANVAFYDYKIYVDAGHKANEKDKKANGKNEEKGPKANENEQRDSSDNRDSKDIKDPRDF